MNRIVKMKVSTLIIIMELAALGGIVLWLAMQMHEQGKLTGMDWIVATLSMIIGTGIILVIARFAARKYAVK